MAEGLEREVKIRFEDAETARRSIEAAGGVESRRRRFEDNRIFDNPERGLSGRGALLRVRATSDGHGRLTYKERVSSSGLGKVRREWELAAEPPGVLVAILGKLGLVPIYRYQKYRTSFRLQDCTVEIDETPMGCFVEIEGPEASIRSIASRLGARTEDLLSLDYRALHRAWLEERGLPPGDMVFGGGAAVDGEA